jgi:hypothetical protein
MLFSLKGGLLKDASLLPARDRFEPPGSASVLLRAYSPECVEVGFSEVGLPLYEALKFRTSLTDEGVERVGPYKGSSSIRYTMVRLSTCWTPIGVLTGAGVRREARKGVA